MTEYEVIIDNVYFGIPGTIILNKELNQIKEIELELYDLSASQDTACVKNKNVVVMFGSFVAFTGKTRDVRTLSDGDTKEVICQCGSIILQDRINFDSTQTDGRKEWNATAGKTIIQELISGIIDEGTIDTLNTIGFRAEYDTALGAVSGVAKICGKNWNVEREIIDGSATTLTETVLTDSTKSWSVDEHAGDLLVFYDVNTFTSFAYVVVSNTATELTCTGTFLTDGLVVTDTYTIIKNYQLSVTHQGSLSSTETFILGEDAIQDEPEDRLNDIFNVIHVLGYGDGINQLRGKGFHATLVRNYLSGDITSTATSITVVDATGFVNGDIIWIGRERCTITNIVTNTFTVTRETAGGLDAYPHKSGIEVFLAKRGATEYDEANAAAGTSIVVNGIIENRFTERSIVDQNTIDFLSQRLLAKYKDEGIAGSFEYLGENTTAVLGDIITITDYDIADTDYRIVGIMHNSDEGSVFIKYSDSSDYDGELIDLKRDMDINNPYGQGATNIMQIQSFENCDAGHPLSIRFRIPDDVIAINRVLMSFKLKDYRAYHTANAGESAHTHSLGLWTENASYDTYMVGIEDRGGGNVVLVGASGIAAASVSDSGSSHTHAVTYGIHEIALTSPSVVVTAGIDGSETAVDTYTTDQTDINIVSNIKEVGNWMNVLFTPNKAMRIEANIYVKCFTKSK